MNPKSRIFSLLIIAVLLAGCAKKDDPVVATYSGAEVRKSELVTAIKNLPERVQEIALQQKKDFLESYVMEKLLYQEAERRGYQHLKDVQELIDQARRKILIAKLAEKEVDSKVQVTPEKKKAFFDNHQSDFTVPYRLRASHILLRSREEADKVLAELKGGADFAETAKKYSLDPTGPKGGDLGYFQKGQLIPEVEEVAFSLAKDQISEPIQTSFGFHIIRVTDIAEPQVKSYDSVEKEIEARLLSDDRARFFTELMDRIKNKAKLTVHEQALSDVALTEKNPPK